jgi:pilus assembly protein CpaB
MEQKKSGGLALGLITGVMLGLMLGLTVGGVWTNHKARKGWNLRPVIVASEDLPAGTVLTFDNINQRSIPEQFVTDSVVKPMDAESIINQRLRVPVKAGDPMIWSHFETSSKQPAPGGQAVGSDSAR